MSFIIKGLNMPKDIKAVELYFIPHINSQEIGISKPLLIKAEDIIEIPIPHGDLIDVGKYMYEGQVVVDYEKNDIILEAGE